MAPRALEHISYGDYLETAHWRRIRFAAIWAAGGRCQLCRSEKDLQVHHNNYDCLFHERPEDLAVLCGQCHEILSLRVAGAGGT